MENQKADIETLKILTTEFRVSHPHVFKPTQMKNKKGEPMGKPQYAVEMLFDKSTTKLSELQAPLMAAAVAKWGKDQKKWPKPFKLPYRDGDKPHNGKDPKPEHLGMWVVKASALAEYARPYVVGRDPKIQLENEADFYPGCYARAALKAHAYEVAAESTGVKFVLDGVQFIRHGKSLGGKKPADQMFGVLEGDDGSEDTGAAFGSESFDEQEDETNVPF